MADGNTEQSGKPNYAEGIKTLRLFQGKVSDIEEYREEEEEEELQERSLQQQNAAEAEDNEENAGGETLFRDKTYFSQSISTDRVPSTISNLKLLANVIFSALVVIAFVDFFLN